MRCGARSRGCEGRRSGTGSDLDERGAEAGSEMDGGAEEASVLDGGANAGPSVSERRDDRFFIDCALSFAVLRARSWSSW
jgi:hypothetical protein